MNRHTSCPGARSRRLAAALATLLPLLLAARAAQARDFRFVAWSDTKHGTEALRALSAEVKQLRPAPALTIFPGDLEPAGFTLSGAAARRSALDGGDGQTFDITFPARGNHDRSNLSGWQAYFDCAGKVRRIGGSHYSELTRGVTYAFDYQNSHFVALDVPGDIIGFDLTAQLAWLDADLAAAEARGLTHAFLFWHGPLYPMSFRHEIPDGSPQVKAVIAVLNRHPIVSATFHGHEHLIGHARMSRSRIPGLTHEFEEFVSGAAGASLYDCRPRPHDECHEQNGFLTVDVSGRSFTVELHGLASSDPIRIGTFTKP